MHRGGGAAVLHGEDSRYKMAALSGRAMCVFVVLKAPRDPLSDVVLCRRNNITI